MQLFWLRTDLRLHDNTALSAAARSGPTVAVFLLTLLPGSGWPTTMHRARSTSGCATCAS